MKITSKLFIAAALFFCGSQIFAQFTGRDKGELIVCDCNKKLDSLSVTFQIPKDISTFDIIGFTISLDGKEIAYTSYNARNLKHGEPFTVNILNPTSKSTQVFPGVESGKFKGLNLHATYAGLCEHAGGTLKLKAQMIGVTQTGVRMDYKTDANTGEITSKTHSLYNTAAQLATSKELSIIQQTKVKGKKLHYLNYFFAALAAGFAYGTVNFLNPK